MKKWNRDFFMTLGIRTFCANSVGIRIFDHTMIGLSVAIASAAHPIESEPRSTGLQYNQDVYIGENVWIGANAVIVPGVRIGNHSVIGAGSVVVRDIPDRVVAVGNPARVIRKIMG